MWDILKSIAIIFKRNFFSVLLMPVITGILSFMILVLTATFFENEDITDMVSSGVSILIVSPLMLVFFFGKFAKYYYPEDGVFYRYGVQVPANKVFKVIKANLFLTLYFVIMLVILGIASSLMTILFSSVFDSKLYDVSEQNTYMTLFITFVFVGVPIIYFILRYIYTPFFMVSDDLSFQKARAASILYTKGQKLTLVIRFVLYTILAMVFIIPIVVPVIMIFIGTNAQGIFDLGIVSFVFVVLMGILGYAIITLFSYVPLVHTFWQKRETITEEEIEALRSYNKSLWYRI